MVVVREAVEWKRTKEVLLFLEPMGPQIQHHRLDRTVGMEEMAVPVLF